MSDPSNPVRPTASSLCGQIVIALCSASTLVNVTSQTRVAPLGTPIVGYPPTWIPLCGLKGVLNESAASTQGGEAPRVIGTVLAEPPPPALYSLPPPTVVHVPTRVNPVVAVNVVEPEAPSAAPSVNESEAGVKEVTDAEAEAVEELPVEESTP